MGSISGSGIGCAGRTRGWVASILRVAAAGAAQLALPGATGQPGSLDLRFEGLRSQKGVIRICLTTNPAGFPDCSKDKGAITRSVPASGGAVQFGDLARGTYVVAVIHDENGNSRLDTFAGIPKEGIGFSRNPRLMFGPPSFASASFAVDGAPVAQVIRMKYFL